MEDNTSFSLVDLSISLMVVFILLFVVTIHNISKSNETIRGQLTKALKEIDDNKASYKEARGKLIAALEEQQIDYDKSFDDPFVVKSIIPEDKLQFRHNEAELLPGGKDFLDSFIIKEAQAVCHGEIKDKIQAIYIIGHANSLGSDEHNLELSQKRALSVMMYALNNKNLSEEERDCLFDVLSVNGRGKREPLLRKDGTEDFRRSRRVEIIHRLKTADPS